MIENIIAKLKNILESNTNSFISLDLVDVSKQLKKQDSNQPLNGVTVAIKDLIDVEGQKTTMGSAQYQNNIARSDADVVRRLRTAGAVIFGKTNTHEFAYGSTGDKSFFGPVLNPNNENHITGGSSSGSAAAVAADLCDVAIGTDTAASVRLPAALCGVIGLKPTYNSIKRDGVFSLSPSLDHVGIISKSLDLIEKTFNSTKTSIDQKPQKNLDKKLTIGLLKGFFEEYICSSVKEKYDETIELLRSNGCEIKEINIKEAFDIYTNSQIVLKYEAYKIHEESLKLNYPFDPEVKGRILRGENITKDEYDIAKKYQENARIIFDTALKDVHVLASLTSGILPPKIFERQTKVNENTVETFFLLTRLTAPINFTGHPAISYPIGKINNLPVGIQYISDFHNEEILFQACNLLQKSFLAKGN